MSLDPFFWLVAVALGLYGLHRFALWLESRVTVSPGVRQPHPRLACAALRAGFRLLEARRLRCGYQPVNAAPPGINPRARRPCRPIKE